MKMISHQRLLRGILPVALLVFSAAIGAQSPTQRIIIDSGDNAMTREEARSNGMQRAVCATRETTGRKRILINMTEQWTGGTSVLLAIILMPIGNPKTAVASIAIPAVR